MNVTDHGPYWKTPAGGWHTHASGTFWAYANLPIVDGYQSGTDTDTESDSGMSIFSDTDIKGLAPGDGASKLYWGYRKAKKRWRRYTGKPVRKARRWVKRRGGSGGRTARKYLNHDDAEAYFKRRTKVRGKGKRCRSHRTFGTGFGSKRNPIADHETGKRLTCHGCGSEDHFLKHCPKRKGGGKAPTFATFPNNIPVSQPQFQLSLIHI